MKDMKEMVANSIKEFMESHNMDQKQFCEYLNNNGLKVGTTTVNVWVNGKKVPARGIINENYLKYLGYKLMMVILIYMMSQKESSLFLAK